MSASTYKIQYLGSDKVNILFLQLINGRNINLKFVPNQIHDVTSITTPDILNQCAAFITLKEGGTYDDIYTQGTTDISEPVLGAGQVIDTRNLIAGAGMTGGGTLAADRTFNVIANADATMVVNANDIQVGQVLPANQAVVDANGIGSTMVLRKALTASGATGAADDVTIFSSNAPFKFRVLDAVMYTSTAAAGSSTAALRTASAGGGTLLSGAMATDANGISRPAGTTPTATSTVASAGSLFLRRSDRAQVGEVLITIVRET